MKIGIIAPSPIPFNVGGTENLVRGLLEYVNQDTIHQAELLKLPSKEHSFWDIVDSYQAFSLLDLSHFDLVISTKYPAWMINHPRHVCYMVHRLRGLYDTYHLFGVPKTFKSQLPIILKLQSFMRDHRWKREALSEFFGLMDELRNCHDLPEDALAFPGPLIREIVNFLDGIGLGPPNIHRYAAISANVAHRKEYFPEGVPVEVIYPPSPIKSFRHGRSDYLLTASRLDGIKRVNLLVEAMQQVASNISLKIAGTGPDQARLMAMASADSRIEFLGRVSEGALADLYADALAVLFVPYDEDYGLVTIEAMMSQKPVITCLDSGGPNEFVRNEETGFSVKPVPAVLAEKITYLCQHPEIARRMGREGRARVEGITWEGAVSRLLGEPIRKSLKAYRNRRPKIVVTSTFPIYPPRHGGQARIYHLYRNITSRFDVDLVTIANAHHEPFEGEIAPGLREIRIPKSPEHQQKEWELEQETGIPIGDVAMPRLYQLTPDYLAALQRSVVQCQLVVASHPYLLPAIMEVSRVPLVYEAQDVEAILKQQVLPDNATGRALLAETLRLEGECCRLSHLIVVCTMSDAESLADLYGVPIARMLEIPNGVDLQTIQFTDLECREHAKKRMGLEAYFVAVFMGSLHPPNLEAAKKVLAFAEALPEVFFLILGSVCLAFNEKKAMPRNVGLMGVVDDETKEAVLALADVGLNPMTMGSGTNLKMLEYMAAGVPVISTPLGARGLGIEHGKHGVICEIGEFPLEIKRLRDDPAPIMFRTAAARNLIEASYDWRLVAKKLEEGLEGLIGADGERC